MGDYQEYLKTGTPEMNLWAAAKSGDVWLVRSLCGAGASLNNKDSRGYSALMYAAYHGHLEAAQYLITQGADPNSTDFGGSTILMGASFKGHSDIVDLLLISGADLNLKNYQGLTATDFARMFGRFEIVKRLENKKTSFLRMVFQSVGNWFTYFIRS